MTRGGASRLILGLMLAAVPLLGQTRPMLDDGAPVAAGSRSVKVYVTAKGKTYHTHRDCIGLSRSKTVLTASEYDAQVQGLSICGICSHRHHAQTGKAGNSTWATPETKEAGK